MGWLNWRLATVALFALISAGFWQLLPGYTYRLLFACVPLLFAAQLFLSDSLESLLISKTGFKTRWFTLLIAPGTILHELCHLFAALATGCTITKAALFKPNPQTGVLGFVAYTQPDDKWTVFREFIVGFAPFFGCGLFLFLLSIPLGTGYIGLVDKAQLTDYTQVLDLGNTMLSSAWDALGTVNYSKPLIWVAIYLQACFAVGSAPSTTDIKGAFSSLYRHIVSAILFLACATLIVLMSQRTYSLYGYEGSVAAAIGICLKFVVIVQLLTIALTLILLPSAYVGARIVEIEGIAKTIPITGGILAAYFISQSYGLKYGLAAGLFLAAATAVLLGSEKTGKKGR